MKSPRVLLGWILVAFAILGGTALAVLEWVSAQPVPDSTVIEVPQLIEASGLAPSHRDRDLLWAQNDSGGEPVFYGFRPRGAPAGNVRIMGVRNRDWEAIASFELDGKPYLLAGDVGDNLARRRDTVLYVVEEPSLPPLAPVAGPADVSVPVAWSIPFHYENGPRDCEALVVDVQRQEIFLISKRYHPAEIFVLPLRPGQPGRTVIAKKVGAIPHIPQPGPFQRLWPIPTARYRGQPTDASLSPDGRLLALLTYGDVLIYERNPSQTWPQALQAKPVVLREHGLGQAEAVCFSADGQSLFVTGEQKHPRLLRYSAPFTR